jgi:rhodanese-related sulfurtransferase/DUF971 family protein
METTEKPVPAEIARANQHDVLIVWKDGHRSLYLARDLRLSCPCASCVEEMTGRKILDPSRVAADVRPLGLNLVGRYAVHFNFSDGHSTGIYSFEHLRGLCRCAQCKPADGRVVEAPAAARRKITPQTTMGEILEQYPSARGTLFRRYHVGGCSSCGYEPGDTLEKVMKSHNVLDLQEVIAHIEQSEELTRKIQIEPRELAALLQTTNPPKLLDVRTPDEAAMAQLEGAQLVDDRLAREIMETWPKETPIVLYCHVGERSLDAASYLIGHGFTNVRSLAGGIDAWAQNVDPKMPRY